MTTTTGASGLRWRAEARQMPAAAAAAFGALLLVSVAVMVLALAAGWLSEFAERLAVAGWTAARTIQSAYPPASAEPGSPPPGGPAERAEEPAVASHV